MSISPTNWMSQMQDKHLYELMIPGTHDSGTEGFPTISLSRTQYYKIDEQLAGGIRFLDMRLAYNSVEQNFHVVHGTDVASNLNFDTVVKWCADFLVANPTETILMSIKQEGLYPGPGDSFATELNDWHRTHVTNGDWKDDLWYTVENQIPTVAQAKSKIILLRRYEVTPNLPGQTQFSKGLDLNYINDSQEGNFQVVTSPDIKSSVFCDFQDQYKQSGQDKKGSIFQFLTNSQSYIIPGPLSIAWTINFASTAKPTPYQAANFINPWLSAALIESFSNKKLYGVLLTDFAQPALWEQLYMYNYVPNAD
jgi:1-phosphatidylinositol phosphodiesterase